mmetsp:Transcript_87405/g.182910  ORF Transcript_87405/g.182910 Transcript_87405/m.182910 type:complete len:229 (+) Transcript_87405:337-1023(+)
MLGLSVIDVASVPHACVSLLDVDRPHLVVVVLLHLDHLRAHMLVCPVASLFLHDILGHIDDMLNPLFDVVNVGHCSCLGDWHLLLDDFGGRLADLHPLLAVAVHDLFPGFQHGFLYIAVLLHGHHLCGLNDLLLNLVLDLFSDNRDFHILLDRDVDFLLDGMCVDCPTNVGPLVPEVVMRVGGLNMHGGSQESLMLCIGDLLGGHHLGKKVFVFLVVWSWGSLFWGGE